LQGRIIAATNRDLAAEMDANRFRHDLYYRLCAVQVTTPSLAEQLSDRPDDLIDLARFAARRILDPNSDEAEDVTERLTEEVITWIRGQLGDGYTWPGNFRELGQCIRNVMVRGRYARCWRRPSQKTSAAGGRQQKPNGCIRIDSSSPIILVSRHDRLRNCGHT
jgi:DNA-binding NtrC family response regulator